MPFFRKHLTLLGAQGLLNVVGAALAVVGFPPIHTDSFYASAISVATVPLVTGFLSVKFQKFKTPTNQSLLFLINLAPVCWMMWAITEGLALRQEPWIPFQTHALGLMTVALLAPPRWWAGVIGLVTITSLVFIQYGLFTPEQLALIPNRSYLAPICFAVFASILYTYRLRSRGIRAQTLKTAVETASVQSLAHAYLQVRDQINTPLQTLTLGIQLLRHQTGEDAEKTFTRITRVLNHLDSLIKDIDRNTT